LSAESEYKELKDRFLTVAHLLDTHDKCKGSEKNGLVDAILNPYGLHLYLPDWLLEDTRRKGKNVMYKLFDKVADAVSTSDSTGQDVIRRAKDAVSCDMPSDPIFISRLPGMCDKEPLLLNAALKIGQVVRDNLKKRVGRAVKKIYQDLHHTELKQIRRQLLLEAKIVADNEKRSFRIALMQEINNSYGSDSR